MGWMELLRIWSWTYFEVRVWCVVIRQCDQLQQPAQRCRIPVMACSSLMSHSFSTQNPPSSSQPMTCRVSTPPKTSTTLDRKALFSLFILRNFSQPLFFMMLLTQICAVQKKVFALSGQACMPTFTCSHCSSTCSGRVYFTSCFLATGAQGISGLVGSSVFPNFSLRSLRICSMSFFLYQSSLAFWMRSSSACLFLACSSRICLLAAASLPDLSLFFSLSLASSSSRCFLMALAFSVNSLSFCLASSGVSLGASACCVITASSSKSGSYLWSSIQFQASLTLVLSACVGIYG